MEEVKAPQFLKACTLERLKGHTGSVTALAYAPAFENEGSFYSKTLLTEGVFASGSEDGSIRLWDIRANKSVIRISEEKFLEAPISSLCFHKAGLELFSASGPLISQFDLRKPSVLMSKVAQSFGEAKDDINKIAVDPTGKSLISCDDKGAVQLRSLETKTITTSLEGKHTNICYTFDTTPKYPNEVISGGFDCFLVKWNISAPYQSKIMNIGKVIYEKYDRTVQMCNPPHVYSVLYDPECTRYLAALGNGAVCSVKRKTLKIANYAAIHGQRIVEAVLKEVQNSWIMVTASNDLSLGILAYEPKDGKIEEKVKIEIQDPPNALLFDAAHQAIYVADTGNDIKRIAIKL